jgi:hypothetical protein
MSQGYRPRDKKAEEDRMYSIKYDDKPASSELSLQKNRE